MQQNSDTPPAACLALAQLGDAAALIDRRTHAVRWRSPAWACLPPAIAEAGDIAAIGRELPGIAAQLEGLQQTACRLCLGERQQWQVEVATLDEGLWLLRMTDRLEQSRAQQRQLDDREQLLFTSSTLSVGEMATTLAHELNQPIGATANLLRGLRLRLSRCKPGVDPESAGALDRALEQVMFAARIITRIRQFTHSHQPRLERIELAGLVRESASLLDWDARRAGAQMVLHLPDPPVDIRGDRVMLQQVLVNLMRNALDALRAHLPADPQLAVRLERNEREAILQVSDNGCGLDEEAESRLFVPFASSKPNGMGIGLCICRSFVELHQGRLWFVRNPGGGAAFHASLPLSTGNLPAKLVEEHP
jgi:C4-dicarboxylate-specific signal transduction histidine kinase